MTSARPLDSRARQLLVGVLHPEREESHPVTRIAHLASGERGPH
jgi:hypothetical protein